MRRGLLALALPLVGLPAGAQTLSLVQSGTSLARVSARPGEIVAVDVVADLGSVAASGVSVYISFPEGSLQVVDAIAAVAGVQPFVAGGLFSGAVELQNLSLPQEEILDIFQGRRLLDYAVVLRFGADRTRSGAGTIATFRLRCLREVEDLVIAADASPVRFSSLVLPGQPVEVPFTSVAGLRLTVKGIDLLDIPDVTLLPGQSDDRQIGRLDKYVVANFAALDSLLWSYSGTGLDSLGIRIDPATRRVSVTPRTGWTGRRRVTWTVAEPHSPVSGTAPPSASETSDLTVNTPPTFRVRRDTVRLVEDQYTYVVSALREPNPARAYRGRDLDLLVDDPEVPASQRHTAFQYGTLTFRAKGDTNAYVRGRVDSVTHELLLWCRPDFAGVDSFRVIVADEYTLGRTGGQDTLRVIVVVQEIPDPPRFIFGEPVITLLPGESRVVALADFVLDRDTPLDRLSLSWSPDVGGHFSAARSGDSLVFLAPADYVGQGLMFFAVSDPDSLADELAQRLNVSRPPPSGDPPPGPPDFDLLPLPELGVQAGSTTEVLTLDEFVRPTGNLVPSDVNWSVVTLDSTLSALVSITPERRVRLRGLRTGVDTVLFTARGPQGRTRLDTARVRVSPGPPETRLDLRPIPDVTFVAGYAFVAMDLDTFVVDRVTHPDSVVRWSMKTLSGSGLLVLLRSDGSVYLTATRPGEVQVAFTGTNIRTGVAARDTVRLTAVDAAYGRLPIQFEPLALPPGAAQTLSLDGYLPSVPGAGPPSWRVAGQRSVQAFIGRDPPHLLRLTAPADRIATDTLTVSADLGRGFGARGALVVRVIEAVDAQTFRVLLIPNPVAPDRVAVYVVARRRLAAPATAVRVLGEGAVSLPLRQIIADFESRGVLVWSGTTTLPRRWTGTVAFQATATTAMGTPLSARASLAYARAASGRPLRLQSGPVQLAVPAGSLPDGLLIALQVEAAIGDFAGSGVPPLDPSVDELLAMPGLGPELVPGLDIRLLPTGVTLATPALLIAGIGWPAGHELYEWRDGNWVWRGPPAGNAADLLATGRYAALADQTPPTIEPVAALSPAVFSAAVRDGGSGVDPVAAWLEVDGVGVPVVLVGGLLHWLPEEGPAIGKHRLALTIRDRAGNPAVFEGVHDVKAGYLPAAFALNRNFPNPFNAGTIIPFDVPAGSPDQLAMVRLSVYNAAGQLLRVLVRAAVAPGRHTVRWDGRDESGVPASSGVYLYRLETAAGAQVRRMTLLK